MSLRENLAPDQRRQFVREFHHIVVVRHILDSVIRSRFSNVDVAFRFDEIGVGDIVEARVLLRVAERLALDQRVTADRARVQRG